MRRLPGMILIAGTGRDSGKTTLACAIIRKFHGTIPLVALKISPHRHTEITHGLVLINEPDIYIEEETDPSTGKDSARMLDAGADRSFFIMASDDRLPKAIDVMIGRLDPGTFLVCESGGLRQWVEPGEFFVTTRKETGNSAAILRYSTYRYHRVEFDGTIGFDISRINHYKDSWRIESNADTV